MAAMNKLRLIKYWALAAVFFRCSLVPFSGGGTEGGNVSGLFVNDDGTASAMVLVRLVPADYNPGAADQNNAIITTNTAANGSYSFDRVRKGNYSVEAVNPASGKRSLITGITVSDKDVRVPIDSLRNPGTIKIFLQGTANTATGYFFVPGTTIFASINGANGSILVPSVPAVTLPAVCYSETGTSSTDTVRYGVAVLSNDTAVVAHPGWKHASRISLNTSAAGAAVTGNVLDFPVLIRLTKNNFIFTQANANGSDLGFARSDTALLPHEIERWDPATELAEVWVNVDTVFGNDSSQYITLYWGNTQATDSLNDAAVFDTSNAFIGVWHMNEDPSAGTSSIKDRTINAHHATPYGSMAVSNSVDGAVGKALAFDGTNDYLNAGNVSVPGTYSIGLWALLDTLGNYQRLITKDSSYTLWYDKDSVSVRMEHMPAGSWWRGLLQDGGTRVPMTTGAWYYFVGTFDGAAVRLYANGAEASVSNLISVNPRTNSKPVCFGASTGYSFVKGTMDEIRIEGTPRSADWIRLCYMNQRMDDKLAAFR
jgi:hypothetical protein